MFKSLAKFFCPSAAKLAEKTAESIQTGYNGIVASKREKIARYTALASQLGHYAEALDVLARDGKIDDEERAKIAAALEPVIEAAKEIVFG